MARVFLNTFVAIVFFTIMFPQYVQAQEFASEADIAKDAETARAMEAITKQAVQDIILKYQQPVQKYSMAKFCLLKGPQNADVKKTTDDLAEALMQATVLRTKDLLDEKSVTDRKMRMVQLQAVDNLTSVTAGMTMAYQMIFQDQDSQKLCENILSDVKK